MRPVGAFALALAVVLAGCLGGINPTRMLSGPQTITAPCDETVTPVGPDAPADPRSDVLGWENGVWYNESIGITPDDGISCGELELVLARTMARVERVRSLEFEQSPAVTIAPRAAFKDQLSGDNRSVPRGRRALANAKFEALFLVNESADAIAIRRRNRGASIQGLYSPRENSILLLTEDVSAARVNEGVLAHELVHALQDQHFPAVSFPGVEDTGAAHRGITEGDANYVEFLYERRCRGPWLGTCLLPDRRDEKSSSGQGLANLGLFVLSYQPYSDGPPFVERIRERGGWAAVNDLYRRLPTSTEQTINPRLYPDEDPTRVTLRTRRIDGWSRVTPDGQPNYETWGERGLFTMFLYPAFESDGAVTIVSPAAFLTPNASALDPYNYSAPPSAGWAGDRLVVYRNGTGELAYAWKLAFDTQRDARQFVAAYRRVLRYRGAHRVADRTAVWRIPEGNPFADAFAVTRTGSTVVIVNAPTVSALEAVSPERARRNTATAGSPRPAGP